VKRALWAFLLAFGLLACGKGAGSNASASASASAPPPPPVVPAAPIHPGVNAPPLFADLAARADAAVVFVKTLQEQRGRTGRRRFMGEGR
jgi:hypothetical protein